MLILASTSRYRAELLRRLGVPFEQVAPDVDETPRGDERPAALAGRLAEAKARAVAARSPGAIVIGSDQVAELDGHLLGKPGTPEAAERQLAASAGRSVTFHTAICVIDGRTENPITRTARDRTCVVFRSLTAAEIARYVEREKPLDCAGSFKSEALGIALFDRVETEDPTALIGLPLIALCKLLRDSGVDPLGASTGG